MLYVNGRVSAKGEGVDLLQFSQMPGPPKQSVRWKPCRPARWHSVYIGRASLIKTMEKKRYRPDRDGFAKATYQKNRARLLASAEVCALCGLPLDKTLKFPNPMSVTADHIIPISKGGDPMALNNLQAVHLICNEVKGSRLTIEKNKNIEKEAKLIGNQVLPISCDWTKY